MNSSTEKQGARVSSSKMEENVSNRESLRDKEGSAREESDHNPFYLFLVNGYAAFLVFFFHLLSLEAMFSIVLSVGLTIITFRQTEGNSNWNGGVMNWTLLSFAIVTPMSASISMAFTRRESALTYLTTIRATMVEIYTANAIWDWSLVGKENSGRKGSFVDWLVHSDSVLTEIIGIVVDLERVLTLPTSSRARHRVTGFGRREASHLIDVSGELSERLISRMGKIALFTEALKYEGLPGNEAARIREWERDSMKQIELLRVIKSYRTPQALRSLCRIFSVFLPPFYAPFYAYMARVTDSLGLGIAFSVITSVALTALFESLSQMEDPFASHLTLDGIDCHRELSIICCNHLLGLRAMYFPNAPSFADDDAQLNRERLGSDSSEKLRLFKDYI